MDLQQTVDEIASLPVEQQWFVLWAVWNNLHKEPPVEIPAELRAELERRMAEIGNGSVELLSWEEVCREIAL